MSKKRKRHEEEGKEAEDKVAGQEDSVSVSAEDGKEEGTSQQALDKATLAHLRRKIFHATKETSRAFKKAKDFEVRKIIKRIKAATYRSCLKLLMERVAEDPQKVTKLEKELQIAKVSTLFTPINILDTRHTSLCRTSPSQNPRVRRSHLWISPITTSNVGNTADG
jgi:hypothetical protein